MLRCGDGGAEEGLLGGKPPHFQVWLRAIFCANQERCSVSRKPLHFQLPLRTSEPTIDILQLYNRNLLNTSNLRSSTKKLDAQVLRIRGGLYIHIPNSKNSSTASTLSNPPVLNAAPRERRPSCRVIRPKIYAARRCRFRLFPQPCRRTR